MYSFLFKQFITFPLKKTTKIHDFLPQLLTFHNCNTCHLAHKYKNDDEIFRIYHFHRNWMNYHVALCMNWFVNILQ